MINHIKAIPSWNTLTNEQIASALVASGLTPQAIPLGELLFLLNNRGMLVRLIRPADSGEKWSGSLVNLINYCNDNDHPLKMHVNQFFSHVTNDRNQTFDTRLPSYGALFALIVSTFAGQPTMPTLEDFQAVASLGGGWLYANTTAQQVADALAAEAAKVAAQAVDALVTAAKNEIINAAESLSTRTVTSIAAAYRDAADMIEGA